MTCFQMGHSSFVLQDIISLYGLVAAIYLSSTLSWKHALFEWLRDKKDEGFKDSMVRG